jgi:hypothetical protein
MASANYYKRICGINQLHPLRHHISQDLHIPLNLRFLQSSYFPLLKMEPRQRKTERQFTLLASAHGELQNKLENCLVEALEKNA